MAERRDCCWTPRAQTPPGYRSIPQKRVLPAVPAFRSAKAHLQIEFRTVMAAASGRQRRFWFHPASRKRGREDRKNRNVRPYPVPHLSCFPGPRSPSEHFASRIVHLIFVWAKAVGIERGLPFSIRPSSTRTSGAGWPFESRTVPEIVEFVAKVASTAAHPPADTSTCDCRRKNSAIPNIWLTMERS